MPWMRQRLRDAEVWAKVDADGAPVADREGRVEIVYKAEAGAKVYRAAARNLTAMGGDAIEIAVGESPAPSAAAGAKPARLDARSTRGGVLTLATLGAAPPNAVHVWTDGGCAPNPGPGAWAAIVIDGAEQRELAKYVGESTNNICELTAIQRGLEAVADKTRPVLVYSDSQYSIGALALGNKALKNAELIASIRALCKQFSDLRFVKVEAHSGIPLNERVDQLVNSARNHR